MNCCDAVTRQARAGVVVALALVVLGGCGTAREVLEGGKKIDYKSSGSLPPLEVPPDLTAPTRDNRYVVPETGKAATTLSVYQAERGQARPSGTAEVLPAVDKMRIERSGSQRWLVVEEVPDKLWPLIKDFWQENGFLVRSELPEAGVMETDWAENRAKIPQDFIRSALGRVFDGLYSTSERDKFRTRLERSQAGGATEIYISHRGMIEVYSDEQREQTRWQPRPADPELEAEFLRRLMIRLGVQEEKAKALMATRSGEVRAAIRKGTDGGELLEVFEPFDRAWRRVGLALDRVGFTVEDRDRAKGLYFVLYADPDADLERAKAKEKPGLLSKLAFWRSEDKQDVKAERYRVVISTETTNSEVRVLNQDGGVDRSTTAHRILALLHEQLR